MSIDRLASRSSVRDVRLPTLVAVNATVLALAVMAGAYTAHPVQQDAEPGRLVRSEGAVFAHVVVANGKVMALMLIGTVSLGVFSALVVTWNGFHLGAGLASLFETQPAVAWLVMRYVPIEFGGLALASAASMQMSYQIIRVLFAGRSASFVPALLAYLCAGVLVLIAAVIEARVAVRIAEIG